MKVVVFVAKYRTQVLVDFFSAMTNNVILKVINAIKKLSENKNEIEEIKAGVPYITYKTIPLLYKIT